MHETRTLARFIAQSQWRDIPHPIRHEGKRALLNWLGCAIGGCGDEAVARAVSTIAPFSGAATVTLLGRSDKLDSLHAAMINALASNILDFDDTHMKTVIHPTVPVAAAAMALAEHRAASGEQLLHAFILGVEAECRLGNAVSPEHYAAGWHITSTCGVIGAAVAAGKLLELSEQQMTWALGIAATQASGLTSMMGSMSKSYNMGHAAHSGLMAALLAARGFTSAEQALEGARGFAAVLARNARLNELTDQLGETWELSWNAYKPFPCGIVLHAAIDACLQLRSEHALTSHDIARIDVRMHPLALELAGKPLPITSLESKLSVHHAMAVALIRGGAGVGEFMDACVRDPAVIALRAKVVATPDATLAPAEAHVRLTLNDARTVERHVAYAIGSLERPMSDADIEYKVRDLAAHILTESQTANLIDLAWSLDRLDDATVLARATVPGG
ncbi:MAG TPA: MmgE/PrpD family protein [Burkholderiales bacterium]|nr:MmgE/PrpD family protein [Burkholderiales bacterium]